MLISRLEDVTPKVLDAYAAIKDDRAREIVLSLIKHMHAFAVETRLTEKEFQTGAAWLVEMGKISGGFHNEIVLMAGSLGFSAVVCLLNNGAQGTEDTSANMLGPFWRDNSPITPNGGSLLRSPTPGIPLFFTGHVRDRQGKPVAGAMVDCWHSSTVGLYENQDPTQADMNLRGRFTTDENGDFSFRSIKPAGYPIPIDGVTGKLLAAAGRHNMRPAHIHTLIYAPGYKTISSQVYTDDDPNLDTDVQFGVTQALLMHYTLNREGPKPAPDVDGEWWSAEYTFTLEPGDAALPRAPITGKATAEQVA